ncbi:hypothetical protein, partial [Elioraea tepidiphila]|uniref:hypothetical protein n=1 Tax=Elioraea tepidiphila TaxID=457934 RepID=UPI001B7FC820
PASLQPTPPPTSSSSESGHERFEQPNFRSLLGHDNPGQAEHGALGRDRLRAPLVDLAIARWRMLQSDISILLTGNDRG